MVEFTLEIILHKLHGEAQNFRAFLIFFFKSTDLIEFDRIESNRIDITFL